MTGLLNTNTTYFLIGITVGIIGIRTLDNDTGFVKTYMVAFIELILMFLAYLKSKEEGKSVLSYLIPITLIIAVFDILNLKVSSE